MINGAHHVVILGLPGAGKTTLAEHLKKLHKEYKVYHSDKFIDRYGFYPGLYKMMEKLVIDPRPKIIEGVLGPRLLRKGYQRNNFEADLVIVCEAPTEVRLERKKAQGKELHPDFEHSLRKVWDEYKSMSRFTNIITYQS